MQGVRSRTDAKAAETPRDLCIATEQPFFWQARKLLSVVETTPAVSP